VKIPPALLLVSERVWLLVFMGIFFLSAAAIYVIRIDARTAEQRIAAKQKEVASVLKLKDVYEARKRALEKSNEKSESVGMSLASVESIVGKTFAAGRLAALKPAALREERGPQQMAIEVSVTGAPLGEITSFLKEARSAGFRVTKLQLTVPQTNATAIDMRAILVQV